MHWIIAVKGREESDGEGRRGETGAEKAKNRGTKGKKGKGEGKEQEGVALSAFQIHIKFSSQSEVN